MLFVPYVTETRAVNELEDYIIEELRVNIHTEPVGNRFGIGIDLCESSGPKPDRLAYTSAGSSFLVI